MSDSEQRGDPVIRLEAIHKTFEGSGQEPVHALSDINLDITRNEFVTLIGPSGCGKTTLLRSIAGLVEPDSGQIIVDGEEIEGTSADRAMVFQSFALLPWATVLENISFGLLLRGDPRKEREEAARELAALVGLAGFEDTRPAELSGGMQQRVGLARALAVRPKVLLMDEPFGSLDEQTKRVMQDVLLEIWERDRTTVVFVTHSIDEAVFLADRVVMMSPRPGRISRIVDVPLPRPRTRDVERSSEFVDMRTSLWEDLLSSRQPTLAESE